METVKNAPGRPRHIPSPTDRRVAELLASRGFPQPLISGALNISPKTLRKRYAAELRRGSAKLEAALIGDLLKIAGKGDATALKAITFCLRSRFGWSPYAPPPPRG